MKRSTKTLRLAAVTAAAALVLAACGGGDDNKGSSSGKVAKGDGTLYRARFAGLAKTQAEAACRHLKRSEIPCFLLKN
jgi:hypothetical protein